MALPAFNHPWVNESYAPTFVAVAPASPDFKEFEQFLQRMISWTKVAQEPYAWIINAANLSPLQRKALAASEAERRQYMKMYQVGLAFVVKNPVIRNVLSAIFLFAPPAVPHIICSEMGEALLWTQKKCNEANKKNRAG